MWGKESRKEKFVVSVEMKVWFVMCMTDVDGHLRLRTPYPVRSVKLSSLKLG